MSHSSGTVTPKLEALQVVRADRDALYDLDQPILLIDPGAGLAGVACHLRRFLCEIFKRGSVAGERVHQRLEFAIDLTRLPR